VDASDDAAKVRSKTLFRFERKDGESTCGGYVDLAWVEGRVVSDTGRRSALFMGHHPGVSRTGIASNRDGHSTCKSCDIGICPGANEDVDVLMNSDELVCGRTSRSVVALFHGDRGRVSRATRRES
jgi:hypothetical protein